MSDLRTASAAGNAPGGVARHAPVCGQRVSVIPGCNSGLAAAQLAAGSAALAAAHILSVLHGSAPYCRAIPRRNYRSAIPFYVALIIAAVALPLPSGLWAINERWRPLPGLAGSTFFSTAFTTRDGAKGQAAEATASTWWAPRQGTGSSQYARSGASLHSLLPQRGSFRS